MAGTYSQFWQSGRDAVMGEEKGGKKGSGREAEVKPTVFIGRLPPGIGQDHVEELVRPFLPVNVRMHKNGDCAFVAFSSFAQAEEAISQLNGTRMSGDPSEEPLHVDLANFKGQKKDTEKSAKLFIGNINRHVDEGTLAQVCGAFGQVVHSKIHQKNDLSPPCGFVTFSSFSEAEHCIASMNGAVNEAISTDDGKVLNVKFADIRPVDKQPLAMHGLIAHPGTGRAQVVHFPPTPPRPPVAAAGRSRKGQLALPNTAHVNGGHMPVPLRQPNRAYVLGGNGANRKVFIGGLRGPLTEEFIIGMMAPFGEIVEANVLQKPGKDPCGFIRFATDAQGEDAIATLSSRGRFVVKWAEEKPGVKRPFDAAFPQ